MRKIVSVVVVVALCLLAWLIRPDRGDRAPAEPSPRKARAEPMARSGAPAAFREYFTPPDRGGISEQAEPAGALRLEGLVLDPGDRPIEGAHVSVDSIPPRRTTTDRGGAFAFESLFGKTYELTARKNDLVGGPVHVRLSGTSDPAVIRLRPGATLEVTTLSKESRDPVAGARVEVRGACTATGTTDARGVSILRGVPPGRATLVARAAGYAATCRTLDIRPVMDDVQEVRVLLKPGSSVTGHVHDQDGEPVFRARVVARETAALGVARQADGDGARTGPEGAFELTSLAPGRYRINAFHPLYQAASSGPFTVGSSGNTTSVEIVMRKGAAISGSVIDPDGVPAPWARVQCVNSDGSPFFGGAIGGVRVKIATADRNGRFRFDDLPRARLVLSAWSDDALSGPRQVDLSARPAAGDLTLYLEASKGIAGMVVDSSGEPVHDAQVSAEPDSLQADPAVRFPGRVATTRTDSGGAFAFRNLAAGAYRLRASRWTVGYPQAMRPGTPARTGDEDVRLVVPSAGGILRGRLAFTGGGHPGRFSVAIGRPPGVFFDSDDGSFEIGGAPPGRHMVFVHGEEFAHVVLEDVAIEEDETTDLGVINVEPGRLLAGRVVGESGAGIRGAVVLCAIGIMSDGSDLLPAQDSGSRETLEVRETASGPDGSFAIDGVGAGARVLIAEHEEYGRSDPVAIPAGMDSEEHVLLLRGFATLAGTVTCDGRPAAAARISAVPEGAGSYLVSVQAGPDGQYEIGKLAAGTYTVAAEVRDATTRNARSASRVVSVEAGEDVRADIDIPPGDINLTVHVEGAEGARIDLAPVHLIQGVVRASTVAEMNRAAAGRAGTNSRSVWVPGRPAEFLHLAPGSYTLCVAPLAGDAQDQAFVVWLKKNLDRLKVHCSSIQLESSPDTQTRTVRVPGMELVE